MPDPMPPTIPDVLVKVRAEIIVRVPDYHPDAQATDGLNEGFRANPDFFVDWSYYAADGHGVDITVLDLDPDTYEEGDAWNG